MSTETQEPTQLWQESSSAASMSPRTASRDSFMRLKWLASVFLFVGLWFLLGCAGVSSVHQPGNQILYVVSNGTITTYGIDSNSLDASPIEQPVDVIPGSATLLQFVPSPRDSFVYSVWSDGQNLQHLSAVQTDSFGVPRIPAIQVLNADSLSQFNMHPRGRFAYMLEITSVNDLYTAEIRLFNVRPDSGLLVENPEVQGHYGPALFWPAFLYGFSTDGSKLYDTSTLSNGAVYRERPINLKTGFLGADNQIFAATGEQSVVLGKLIVEQFQGAGNQGYINIFPNTPNPRGAVIHCTAGMLRFCASATDVQLDKSGHYLFLTDPATQAVHIAVIQLSKEKVRDTGAFLPMTSQTPGFAFSPDESVIYAMLASDNSVHFYHFNLSTGSLAESGTPLPLAADAGICPAER